MLEMLRTLTSRSRRSAGQTLVEFALVFPVIILLIVAAADIGRGVFAYNSITNAVREGARMAIVNQDLDAIKTRATSQAAIAEAEAANLDVLFYQADTNGDPDTDSPCGTPVPVDCLAVLTYETRYQPITPIIASILWPTGVTLQATAVLPVEYTCPNGASLPAGSCPKQP